MTQFPMTAEEFATELEHLGLSYSDFARLVTSISGRRYATSTVWRWINRQSPIPPPVIALVRTWRAIDRIAAPRRLPPEALRSLEGERAVTLAKLAEADLDNLLPFLRRPFRTGNDV